MKIILTLLALTSLLFTVLGNPAGDCHDYEEKCSANERRPAILQCMSNNWHLKQACSPREYCSLGPPVACKKHYAVDARSAIDAAFADACNDGEETCNDDQRHPAILQCNAGTWGLKKSCLGGRWCDHGPPASCKLHHADARSVDDATSANDAASADTCNEFEEKCNDDTHHPAILQCISGTWDVKKPCLGGRWCDPGPPASCKLHH